MKAEHKYALATAGFLVLLGTGSILFGPARGPAPRANVERTTAAEAARLLIVPIAGVGVDALVDSWGAARAGGRRHAGVDIMASIGTPVRAAASGTIAKLFVSKRGGLTLYQNAESGRVILYYAHLSGYAIGLKEGAKVAQGDVVGFVGATGNATSPHLHFEVQHANPARQWWRGQAVNPYLALKAGRVDAAPVHASLGGRGG